MTTESIQLNVPKILYQRVLSTAQQTQCEVHDMLLEAIAQVFGTDVDQPDRVLESSESIVHEKTTQQLDRPHFFAHPRQAEMETEVATFEALHDKLWTTYPNQYIAMNNGSVIDYDSDESLLVERIDEEYPDDIVLIRQVQSKLPGVLRVRSPRLESSTNINTAIGRS